MQIKDPGAHLDHFMRQTRIHHVQLSAMADVKASMMITAASLVLTFSVRYLTVPAFQWATLLLILSCAASITCAIYATMPKLPRRSRGKLDAKHPLFNLLFFGSFIDLDYDEYVEAMEHVCNDPSRVYESMMREIYTLGVFLAHKKYRYLRWAYQCFLFGIFSSMVAMAVSEVIISLGYEPWTLSFGILPPGAE